MTIPNRKEDLMAELRKRIASALPGEGVLPVSENLRLTRRDSTEGLNHGMSAVAFCVVAQGAKEVYLAEETFRYDENNYLIGTAELPVSSKIVEASPENPFLCFVLMLDPARISQLITEANTTQKSNGVMAMNVCSIDEDLLDAVVRYVRLLDTPDLLPFMSGNIEREIIYRLLIGEQGARLRQFAVLAGQTHRISAAIERIRTQFDKPMRINDIAAEIGMSTSGFHHHFKSVTGMSPLQFQKQIRLREARNIMLSEHLDAANAGYRVGYDDASHFSRDYKRLFGAPPMRDVQQLRESALV